MWKIPNSGSLKKKGQNERLGVTSTKWLSLTLERFPHHTRPTFTRSTLLRGLAPHTARNKRSAVTCHFSPAILARFVKYFTRKCPGLCGLSCRLYAKRQEQWASCYRISTTVNTNMFVESFHRLLKIVYLQHKQNRRIDYLLNVLLKISRDKTFERLTKLEKGKRSHRICEINKRHQSAADMLKKSPTIQQCGTNKWLVKSLQRNGHEYYVSLSLSQCSCQMKCIQCNICVHMYTCTCLDATLHTTVCKHIHAVCMSQMQHVPGVDSTAAEQGTEENLQYFSKLIKSSSSTSSSTSNRVIIKKQLDELYNMISNCTNQEAMKAATKHLRAAAMAIKSITSQEGKPKQLPVKRHYAPNKKGETQRFHSTKKKKASRKRWAKPTQDEIQSCASDLKETEAQFCGVCFKKEDTSDGDDVHWVECCECTMWIHTKCDPDLSGTPTSDVEYTCQFCR